MASTCTVRNISMYPDAIRIQNGECETCWVRREPHGGEGRGILLRQAARPCRLPLQSSVSSGCNKRGEALAEGQNPYSAPYSTLLPSLDTGDATETSTYKQYVSFLCPAPHCRCRLRLIPNGTAEMEVLRETRKRVKSVWDQPQETCQVHRFPGS